MQESIRPPPLIKGESWRPPRGNNKTSSLGCGENVGLVVDPMKLEIGSMLWGYTCLPLSAYRWGHWGMAVSWRVTRPLTAVLSLIPRFPNFQRPYSYGPWCPISLASWSWCICIFLFITVTCVHVCPHFFLHSLPPRTGFNTYNRAQWRVCIYSLNTYKIKSKYFF